MPRDDAEFDPENPQAREIGQDMADQDSGLSSIAAHLYRGEVDRAVTWRGRLDSTTNWAVTLIAGILAYAFSSTDISHTILLVAMLIGTVFLIIEAQRFRRYDVWRSRVRTLQENLFANALDPTAGVEDRDWRRQLSDDYRTPHATMPLRQALSHRLRRVYLPLLVGLLLVWLFRLSGESGSIFEAAALADTPGWLVITVVLLGYLCLIVLTVQPDIAVEAETRHTDESDGLDR